ncbi:hypothetical protein [Bartonella vinsonii]|uniref:hypothetical protein n=1 Tax=Bartonella vinsonii TaxID=33047 RepID=UPI00047BB294|nr:hypothetical protein [Bartonella vinsonii]
MEEAVGDFGFYELLRSQYALPPWEKDEVSWCLTCLRDLGAFALFGDFKILRFYRKVFAEGDELGGGERRFETNIFCVRHRRNPS